MLLIEKRNKQKKIGKQLENNGEKYKKLYKIHYNKTSFL